MDKTGLTNTLWKLIFIITPIVEGGIIVLLTNTIGAFNTFSLIGLSTVLGFLIEKLLWDKNKAQLNKLPKQAKVSELNEEQFENLTESTLFMFAFILFLTPGFITDAIGFSMLIPFTRKFWKTKLIQWHKEYETKYKPKE